MAAPPLGDNEIRFLKALVDRNVRFMLVGLSAAALQGAPVVTQDIDLWFENLSDEQIREALRTVGAVYVPSVGLNPPMFAGGGVELFDIVLTMSGLGSFAEEAKACVEISLEDLPLKVLALERILVSKRAANRLKDRLVIPVLEDTVAVRTTSKDSRSDSS